MKICIYLELERWLKHSGMGSAVNNHRRALELNHVDYTHNLKEDFDILHVYMAGPKSLHAIRKARTMGKKVITHAHLTADDFRGSYCFSNEIAPFLQRYLVYFHNQADLVLCPSEYTKNVLKGYGVKREIRVVSNGIDVNKFKFSAAKRKQFREEYGLDGIIVFSVGHIFIKKGIGTFVDVARKFQNKFVWIGRRYKGVEDFRTSKILKSAPKNVIFTGHIKDIDAGYSGCDIFFFPSFCENQGIVTLEASVYKRPILVRDIPVYDGWLINEVNCLKAKTDEEFGLQLKKLLENEQLRHKLTENAYKLIEEHSLEKVGAQLKEVYEYLVRK
jgi:1,2-diacylglycerol-3-alpha-glucose alpha-1,2-glucosyltransferase